MGSHDGLGSGIDRRTLIRRGALAAGVVWTAPLVIESVTSPAGALSPVGGYPCSYITVVYQVGSGFYAAKFNKGASTCSGNSTSGDVSFTESCGSVWYDNGGSGNAIRRSTNGTTFTTLADAPTGQSCSTYVSYGGGTTINAINGAAIVFAVAHDGSYSPIKNKYLCPASPSSTITAPSCGG